VEILLVGNPSRLGTQGSGCSEMNTSAVGGVPLDACSACAGDYEDPERTSCEVPERDGDEDEEQQLACDDFPVQRS
jgi:hypothetical protein